MIGKRKRLTLRIAGFSGGVIVAILAALAAVTIVSAHAKVTEVAWDNPTNPTKVTATAVEEIADTAGTYSLKVYNSDNVEVDKGDTTIDPTDATMMSVSVNANLPNGVYRVDWATVSAGDGDAANDSLQLGLGVALTTPSPTPAHKASVTATLTALNSSGVSGTAVLTPTDDGGTEVVVNLTGLAPNTTHIEHVHVGATCASQASQLGDHLVDLDDITADASGNGTSDTDADVAFVTIADGTNKIAVHAGPDASTDANKVPIACGAIPSALTAATVPSTGGAPAAESSSWLLLVVSGFAISATGFAGLVLSRRRATEGD